MQMDEFSYNSKALWPSIKAEFEKARTIQEQLLQEHPGDRALAGGDLGWTLSLEEWRFRAMMGDRRSGRDCESHCRIPGQLVAEDPADPFARDDLGVGDLHVHASCPDELE